MGVCSQSCYEKKKFRKKKEINIISQNQKSYNNLQNEDNLEIDRNKNINKIENKDSFKSLASSFNVNYENEFNSKKNINSNKLEESKVVNNNEFNSNKKMSERILESNISNDLYENYHKHFNSKSIISTNIIHNKVNNKMNNKLQNNFKFKNKNSFCSLLDKLNNSINNYYQAVNDSKINNYINISPNEINNIKNEINLKNKQENNSLMSKTLLNQNNSKNKKENNILSNQINKNEFGDSFIIDTEDDYYRRFFEKTKYEKELSSNFKYFNIFWYAKFKTNKLKYFTKCFENVEFKIGYGVEETIDFFRNELISEWIIINEGYHVPELLFSLPFKNIKSFLVLDDYKYFYHAISGLPIVGCITLNPQILCEKLLELNKNYIIPNFNYEYKLNKKIIFEKKSEPIFKIKSKMLKTLIESGESKNEYNNLCIKFINYFEGDQIENDFEQTEVENDFNLFYFAIIFKENGKDYFKSKIKEIKQLTLISLYFSKYPYLFNLFSNKEIKDILKISNKKELSEKMENQLPNYLDKLYKKIMKNESILDEKDALKNIQMHFIIVLYLIDNSEELPIDLFNCHQFVNFFKDIDFVLKLAMLSICTNMNNKKFNFIDQIYYSLAVSEPRFNLYINYFRYIEDIRILSEEEENIIKEALTIKDFIIIGDNNFHQKIRGIEKYIKYNTIKYLKIEQLLNYLEEKKKENRKKIWIYFYFLIIKYEELQEDLETIFTISHESGVSFLAFVYVENEDITKIPKNKLEGIISIIFVNSPEDIINYLSQKLNFHNPIQGPELEEIGDFLNIKIPKITFEQNDEDIYQNGCFELAETFDINLIKNNFIYKVGDRINYKAEFCKYIYYIYKEHNSLDLFIKQNCIYFGWNLYPELIDSNICYIKKFLYMYCREEKESQKSFYRIINDDLRSRDPYKIYRYISILSLINSLIEKKFLKSFNGKVYRATKLDENLIKKLVPGKKMINTTFWSTSKEFKVAENFMIKHNWRNSFIICEAKKNNIDIDSEKLNPFNEKEILFLPFTEFIINKVSSEIKYGKKIFIIELTELDNKNVVNADNMNVIRINNLGVQNQIKAWNIY